MSPCGRVHASIAALFKRTKSPACCFFGEWVRLGAASPAACRVQRSAPRATRLLCDQMARYARSGAARASRELSVAWLVALGV